MFCPGCGSEERQASQFCRACGTDLRAVRVSLEQPDSITASAVSAREDIGRAVAAKIREVQNADELAKVAEEVLPEIEKFLESPAEKRLRRIRDGVITAAIGLGVGVPALASTAVVNKEELLLVLLMVIGCAAVCFVVGLGLVLNGLLFTRPREGVKDHSADADLQKLLDDGYTPPQLRSAAEAPSFSRTQTTSGLARVADSSVTEHTTHHLKTDR